MKRTPRQRLRLLLLRSIAWLSRAKGICRAEIGAQSPELRGAFRILIIRPDHLGDLLFTTPALRFLRELYPEAEITALVGPWGVPVLENNTHVDRVVALPFPGFSRQPKPSFWQPYRLLLQWARHLRGRYELVLVMRFDHWWGALLAYLADIPQRVGYAVPEVAPFLVHPLPYGAGRHEVEQNLRMVEWAATRDDRSFKRVFRDAMELHSLEFCITDDTMAKARKLLQGTRPIAIHPGAGAPIKLWRGDRWAMVADTLARESGAPVLLTGSEAERPLCVELASGMKTGARVMAGETTLEQLAAIFGECRLVLGLDSGPLHLAVAMGTPTVHLYGPVDAAMFGPWGPPGRHKVVRSAWPCIPCNRLDYPTSELEYHPCVKEISVDAVVTAALHVISA